MAGDFPYERDVDEQHQRAHRVGAHPLAFARAIAERIVAELAPHCDRIEIAGSIRRRAEHVKDIEIVAIPRVERDLLGVVDPSARTVLDTKLDALVCGPTSARYDDRDGVRLAWRLKMPSKSPVSQGPRFKALYAIRTGPADYSRRLVTVCQELGLQCRQGRLVRKDGTEVATPEERDFVEACGETYLEPWERR